MEEALRDPMPGRTNRPLRPGPSPLSSSGPLAELPRAEPSTPGQVVKRDGRKDRHERQGSLVEFVRERFLDDIIQGRFAQGRVIHLAALADRYGISKTPVREALALLRQEGLVEVAPYKGYYVRPLDLREFNDIFAMRELLEVAAAELAATHITNEQLRELERLRAPDVSTMTLEYDRYAHRFHSLIAQASRNTKLAEFFELCYNNVRRLQYAGIGRPQPRIIAQEHDEILDALRRRDAPAAAAAMRTHIQNIRRRALEP
jgi:DNA-binding GntR family transcriptional regulator